MADQEPEEKLGGSGDEEMKEFPQQEEDPAFPADENDDDDNQRERSEGKYEDKGDPLNDEEAGSNNEADFFADRSRFDLMHGGVVSGTYDYETSRQRRRTGVGIGMDADIVRTRKETAVPLGFVIQRIRHEIESSALMTDLIIFIPFVVLFLVFFLAGSGTEANFYILKGVRDVMFMTEFPKLQTQLDDFRDQILTEQDIFIELDKRYIDIQNGGDWHDFLVDVVVEHTFDCKNPNVSHPLLAPIGQDYHFGALRFRTQRMRSDSCSVDSNLYPDDPDAFPQTCWSKHSKSKEEKVTPRCPNKTHPLTGEVMFNYYDCSGWSLRGMDGTYHCGGYSFEIPFNATCEQARAVLETASDGDCIFIDNWATRISIAEWFFYTPSTDMWHSIKLFVEGHQGGQWNPQYSFRSFKVWTSKETLSLVLDMMFFIYVCYYWVLFFIDFVRSIKNGCKVLGFLTEFWNILEFINLTIFTVIFVFRWIWLSKSLAIVDDLKFNINSGYPDNLDEVRAMHSLQIYCSSINTVLTFLKVLKYVRLNERLGVLGRTIANCQQSIFGVLILFCFIVLSYGLTGWNLFGIALPEFRGLGVSMSSLMRILTGQIDYESMRRENRFLAGAFFWSYVILALFLLLNFIIAIITKSFEEISGKAFAQDFDETLVRVGQRLRLYLQCSNIKRLLRAAFVCGAKTEISLLRVVLENLEAANEKETAALSEARRLRNEERRGTAMNENDEAEFEDEEEGIQVMMMRNDWITWVDQEVYNELTDLFFDYTWDGIMCEYDDARRSSEEVQKRQMLDTVRGAVEKLVTDDVKKISELDETLSQLEKEILRLKEYLKK